MPIDVPAAARFLATSGRLVDRRRFELLVGEGDTEAVLAALDAYRNADGGYGWGLEPDLRSPESQPIQALHAFEVMAECGVVTGRAVELCDWLATVALDDGGLPFTLPIGDPAGCAPWFGGADPTTSSLQGTAAVLSEATRVAHQDAAVAAHPWFRGATAYCLDAIGAAARLSAYETLFALRFLEAVGEAGAALLARLAGGLPASGAIAVEGGLEGEHIHPLDYAPAPGSALRSAVPADVVDADLLRVETGQQPDGGWTVDFASFSPRAALDWRGYATLQAVRVLIDNGRQKPL
ncbi:MAG TPA: hypothetical protein VM938_03280 [Acidimicrobiales bacterium]|nr:hypothetical protein [Acidimicrobiales bacterium]